MNQFKTEIGKIMLFACSVIVMALSPVNAMEKVRVGTTSSISDAGVFIAQEKGYFKAQGIDVEVTRFPSAVPMLTAIATGQIDVARGAQSAGLFNSVARGIKLKLVADGGRLSPGGGYFAIAIRKDLVDSGGFKSAADLRGRTVVVAGLSGSSVIVLDRYLRSENLTMKDINIKSISVPDQIAAFANKAIDAAVMLEPSLSESIKNGIVVRWKGGDEIYPNMQGGVLAYSDSFSEKIQVGRNFMIAYIRGLRDYYSAFFKGQDRDGIVKILMKYTNIKDPEAYARMTPVGVDPDGKINTDGLKSDLEWYIEIDRSVRDKVDFSQMIDMSYADYAVQRLGKYAK